VKRLTREEFIGLIRHRGYSLTAVGQLWGVSRSRISQIAADAQRPAHWDYSLWGLPARLATARVEARRLRLLLAARAKPSRANSNTRPPARLPTVEVGDVWIVRDSPGAHLPERCEGTVQAVTLHAGLYYILLRFAVTGYEEAFPVSYLQQPDCFLAATGRNVRQTKSDP
jgi:hypothetical protein